jgi:type II secretory pathway component PulM
MTLIERIRSGRSEREMRTIVSLAWIAAFVLAYAFAWLPLERTRNRLERELPVLRASVESMQQQADAAKKLRAMPPSASQQAAVSTLAATPPAGAQVTAVDLQRVRLTAADAAFTTLLEWIVAAQASHGLRVESAHVDALPSPGRVKAEFLLSRS